MKNILPVFLLGLISVPFAFNSCQGGFQSQASVGSSLSSASCKVTLEEGQVKKLNHSYKVQPQTFSSSKLQLRDPKSSISAFQKSGSEIIVSKDTELSAVYDNLCLSEGGLMDSKAARLWDLISPDGELKPLPELIRQAYVVDLDRDYSESELNELVENDPCVVGVSWNNEYRSQAVSFTDTSLYQQGHLESIKAMDAYTGLYDSSLSNGSTRTSKVRVAVIDSGVDWQHPDLQPNFWVHSQGWGIDATTIASNLVNYNPFDISSNGHGTHIAGLIGAVSNNNIGVVGTMPFNVQIMAVKVFKLDSSQNLVTNSTYLYNGMQFAILNKADVMNMSLMAEGSSYDSVISSALDDALESGITVVAAMGNGNPGKLVDGSSVRVVPASYAGLSGVMAVGSYDSATGQKSSFSHYSTTFAEISAPGAENGTSQGVFSTLPTGKGSYGRLAGTSQATGIVSGAAALAVGLIKKSYGMAPSPTEVERLIVESAYKNSNLSAYFKNGNQLDLMALVNKIYADYPATQNGASVAPVNCSQ